MKKIILVALLAIVVTAAWGILVLQPPAPLALPERGARIPGVVLVVPGAGRLGPVDLVVEGGRIADIQPATSNPINGYVLPGLSDAHMHDPTLPLPGHDALFAFLYLYHGVTLTRLAAGGGDMRNAIRAGSYPGPRMLSCGPFVDGSPPQWPGSLVVPDEIGAAQAVESIRAQGYDCVKVYNELTEAASRDIRAAATAAGLPVIGHVPWRQDFRAAHIDDLQHTVGWAGRHPDDAATPYVLRLRRVAQLDAVRIDDLVDAATRRGFRLTPTLVTLQRKSALAHAQKLRARDSSHMLPRFYREQLWHPTRGLVSSRLMSPQDHRAFEEALPPALEVVGRMHAAGVELHTGTDSPAEFIVPGAGLIEELGLFASAGLSAEEVLKISAVDTPRRLLGDDTPPLSVGSRADFVVYADDPTENLANLATRTAVVADGRLYDRDQLERQLQVYRDWFDAPAYRRVTESLLGAGLWLLNALGPSGSGGD